MMATNESKKTICTKRMKNLRYSNTIFFHSECDSHLSSLILRQEIFQLLSYVEVFKTNRNGSLRKNICAYIFIFEINQIHTTKIMKNYKQIINKYKQIINIEKGAKRYIIK